MVGRPGFRTLGAALLLLAPVPALADPGSEAPTDISAAPVCADGVCQVKTTAPNLLAHIEALVRDGRYAQARPLLKALAAAPGYRLETRFLTGLIAAQIGDLRGAEAQYRAILNDDPKQVRVRFELGKTLLAEGKTAAGDHQLWLVAQSDTLPPEIARSIRTVRNIIRSKRAWSLNVDFGLVPDSNINNATGADTITVLFGSQPIPLSLDKNAQARSGLGVTGSLDGNLRLPVAKDTLWLVDFDAFATQYKGTAYDDLSMELAGGPEFKLSEKLRVRGEAVVSQRDFGNRPVTRQYGGKGGAEYILNDKTRLGLQLDVRHTDALFDRDYSGTQMGVYGTYERAVAKSMIASASVFVRRDSLVSDAMSSTEIGGLLGIGGELPKGLNFGISAGASHAAYDAASPFFSLDPRRDWRLNGRITLGDRAIRVFGFSPTVTLSYARNASSIAYYTTQRTRVRFALARYF